MGELRNKNWKRAENEELCRVITWTIGDWREETGSGYDVHVSSGELVVSTAVLGENLCKLSRGLDGGLWCPLAIPAVGSVAKWERLSHVKRLAPGVKLVKRKVKRNQGSQRQMHVKKQELNKVV